MISFKGTFLFCNVCEFLLRFYLFGSPPGTSVVSANEHSNPIFDQVVCDRFHLLKELS